MQTAFIIPKSDGNFKIRKDKKPMKDYKKIICLTATVCLLGAAAFCGYHIQTASIGNPRGLMRSAITKRIIPFFTE